MTYRVLANSNRIEKDFLRIITSFSEDEQKTIWQILQTYPKGSGATHWTIKKVYREGIRLTRDSWNTTIVTQKRPECPSLEATASGA
jgi:hypothetical protein